MSGGSGCPAYLSNTILFMKIIFLAAFILLVFVSRSQKQLQPTSAKERTAG
jgi:preprotein translocase subunit SecG